MKRFDLLIPAVLVFIMVNNVSAIKPFHKEASAISKEINGQAGSLKLSESFETWPPAGWTFASPDGGRGWERYSVLQDKLYGGGGYAATAGYQTGGSNYNDQWMISPAISVEAGDRLSFWMFVVNALYYMEKVEIRVSTTGNKTENFTTILETVNLTGGIEFPWTFKWFDLSPYAGNTIYIAIREFQSDKTQYPILLIDLFKVGKLPINDGALTEITVPGYLAPGLVDVTGKFLNLGTNPVSSFNIEYQVDKGIIEKKTMTGLSLQPGSELSINFNSRQYDATTGYHTMKMWTSNVSGPGNDEDQTNDTLTKILQVSSLPVSNTPLFEEFTSSTCPPCAFYNSGFINPFFSSHVNDLTLIKYQMNWPGTGDPYYNADGGIRRSFYRTNGVPTLYAGGKASGLTSTDVLNSSFNLEKNRLTYLSLNSSHQLNTTSRQINMEVNITPYVNSTEFTLYVAVVEKETSGNVKTNGETSFHHVMMKMIPDARGTALNLTDKVPLRVNLAADLSSTKIEEWTDVSVVAFIQNNETKEVIQSAYSSELKTFTGNDFHLDGLHALVFPSPFSDILHIRVFQASPSFLTINIFSPEGRKVWTFSGKATVSTGDFSWNGTTSSGQKVPPGLYILRIRSEKQEIIRKVIYHP